MKIIMLASFVLMLASTAFPVGLPSDMAGPVCGFLSSKESGTYNYTSQPVVAKIGSILDGILIFGSEKFSDFSIFENSRFTVYKSRAGDNSVEVLIPKPFRSFYMISIKRDNGIFEGYTINQEVKAPN